MLVPVARRRFFTLVEMLVVMAILLILIALISPALKSALDQARMVQCMSNMRQVALATATYVQDNDGLLPSAEFNYSDNWSIMATPYRELMRSAGYAKEVYTCPTDVSDCRRYYVGSNPGLGWLDLADIFALPNDARMRISYGMNLYACTPFYKYEDLYQARVNKWLHPDNTMIVADSTVFLMTVNIIGEYNRIALANLEGNWPAYPPFNYNYKPAVFPELSRHGGYNNVTFMDMHVKSVLQVDTYDIQVKHD